MERSELRPYAAAGVALLGTGLVAAAVSMSSPAAAPQLQSPAVENTAAADAFAILANAFDPTASSDGLLALANSFDSDLDLLGTPTVNVADTLATDLVGLLDVGNSLGTIDGDINSGFALLDSDLSALTGSLTGGLGGLRTLDTDLTNSLNAIDQTLGTLSTINTNIVGLDSDLDLGFRNLFDALSTDLSPLSTIATELGNTGIIAGDLSSIYDAILALISIT